MFLLLLSHIIFIISHKLSSVCVCVCFLFSFLVTLSCISFITFLLRVTSFSLHLNVKLIDFVCDTSLCSRSSLSSCLSVPSANSQPFCVRPQEASLRLLHCSWRAKLSHNQTQRATRVNNDAGDANGGFLPLGSSSLPTQWAVTQNGRPASSRKIKHGSLNEHLRVQFKSREFHLHFSCLRRLGVLLWGWRWSKVLVFIIIRKESKWNKRADRSEWSAVFLF